MGKNNVLVYSEIKLKCTGCGACFNICPVDAIEMVNDDEGFAFPKLSEEKCIDCKKCINACQLFGNQDGNEIGVSYGFSAELQNMNVESSSGGVFSTLATDLIKKGWWIYGTIYDQNNQVVQVCSKDINVVRKMFGSKYVQSNNGLVFKEVKSHLEGGENVLCCSVPCTIAGLKGFLQKEYENLYCIDLLCYGVPSPKLFSYYLSWNEKKHRKVIEKYIFRDKKAGGNSLSPSMFFDDGTVYTEKSLNNDPYFCAYISKKTLRESCYTCSYCSSMRYGDITIGDFWGVELSELKTCKEAIERGMSAVMVNSKKGEYLLEILRYKGFLQKVQLDNIVKHNDSLVKPPARHNYRDLIYRELDKKNFEIVSRKYMYLKPYWKKQILSLVPLSIKQRIHELAKTKED